MLCSNSQACCFYSMKVVIRAWGYGTRVCGSVWGCKACWDSTAELLRWSNHVLYLLLWEQSPKSNIASLCLDMVLEGATWRSLDTIREWTGNSVLWMLVVPVFELASRTSFIHLSKYMPEYSTEGSFQSTAASSTWNLCSAATCFRQGALFIHTWTWVLNWEPSHSLPVAEWSPGTADFTMLFAQLWLSYQA